VKMPIPTATNKTVAINIFLIYIFERIKTELMV